MKEQGKMVPSNEEKDAPQTKVSQMCDPLDNNFFFKKKNCTKHAQSADRTTEKALTENREMMNEQNYLAI